MAENETEQLSSKCFNILKDIDIIKNANTQALSDNLTNYNININKELNLATATAYLNEIEKINKKNSLLKKTSSNANGYKRYLTINSKP